MTEVLFIGIDIGTQGTKAVLCNEAGTVINEAFCESKLIRPDINTVYEEPSDILNASVYVIKQLTESAGERSKNIRAIGIDAQMAGIMGIDKNYNTVIPFDSWLDTKCAKYTEILKKEAGQAAIEKSGGQFMHAHAPKILWWKNEQPEKYNEVYKFIQPNSYVAGVFCDLSADDAYMDYTFLHFNLFSDNRNCCFNEELLKYFDVDPLKMPKIVSPQQVVGTVSERFAKLLGLPKNVKVIAGCGDTAASSLGAGITRKGLAYDVAGTASVFACCTDRFVPDVINHTLLFSRSVCDGLYLPLSYISGGGLCLKWLSEISGKDLKTLDSLVSVNENKEIPMFIPHFAGRTFPLDDNVSGAFIGLKHQISVADLHRAVMEAIAYEYKIYCNILCSTGCMDMETTVIGVGGGAKSRVFSQIKADVLGLNYVVPQKVDSAPVAVAILAAYSTGYLNGELRDIFKPDLQNSTYFNADKSLRSSYATKAERYNKLLENYGKFAN